MYIQKHTIVDAATISSRKCIYKKLEKSKHFLRKNMYCQNQREWISLIFASDNAIAIVESECVVNINSINSKIV